MWFRQSWIIKMILARGQAAFKEAKEDHRHKLVQAALLWVSFVVHPLARFFCGSLLWFTRLLVAMIFLCLFECHRASAHRQKRLWVSFKIELLKTPKTYINEKRPTITFASFSGKSTTANAIVGLFWFILVSFDLCRFFSWCYVIFFLAGVILAEAMMMWRDRQKRPVWVKRDLTVWTNKKTRRIWSWQKQNIIWTYRGMRSCVSIDFIGFS